MLVYGLNGKLGFLVFAATLLILDWITYNGIITNVELVKLRYVNRSWGICSRVGRRHS